MQDFSDELATKPLRLGSPSTQPLARQNFRLRLKQPLARCIILIRVETPNNGRSIPQSSRGHQRRGDGSAPRWQSRSIARLQSRYRIISVRSDCWHELRSQSLHLGWPFQPQIFAPDYKPAPSAQCQKCPLGNPDSSQSELTSLPVHRRRDNPKPAQRVLPSRHRHQQQVQLAQHLQQPRQTDDLDR